MFVVPEVPESKQLAQRSSRAGAKRTESAPTTSQRARCSTTATAATESGGAHFTMSGSRQFHKGVRIKSIAQGKAGKCKVQAGRNKANRGNSSVARAVKR